MYPQSHFLFPLFLGAVLTRLGLADLHTALLAAAIGALVDLDHYVEYVIHHHDFLPNHAWNAAVVKHEITERSFIHHVNGMIMMTVIMSIAYTFSKPFALALAVGYYSHMFLDYTNLNIFNWKRVFKIKEEGFVITLPMHELLFDCAMALLVIALN